MRPDLKALLPTVFAKNEINLQYGVALPAHPNLTFIYPLYQVADGFI
jgi:hypothetical protein